MVREQRIHNSKKDEGPQAGHRGYNLVAQADRGFVLLGCAGFRFLALDLPKNVVEHMANLGVLALIQVLENGSYSGVV